MNFPYYIARRYLFSKKKKNIINVISLISMVVVATVTAAMIVVLSAFNGIEVLVEEMFSTFDAEITVMPASGKTIHNDSLDTSIFDNNPKIAAWTAVIEEDVMLKYRDKVTVATLKAVDESYHQVSQIDSAVIAGDFLMKDDEFNYALVGVGIRSELRLPLRTGDKPMITVFAPVGGRNLKTYRENAFNKKPIMVSGAYSVNAELDVKYIIVPLEFGKKTFNYENEVSAFEMKLQGVEDLKVFKKELQQQLGDNLKVITRYDKNALIYKTNASEKWATFLILLFILVIAAFNILASLTMLVIEKKKDIFILQSMGTQKKTIRRIFFLEGVLINLVGALAGLIIGVAICLAQQHIGILRLQGSIVEFYPMRVAFLDVLGIFGTVLLIGSASSFLLVHFLVSRYGTQEAN
ncbi:FtsX-like permease family protein [Halocola ammonii]